MIKDSSDSESENEEAKEERAGVARRKEEEGRRNAVCPGQLQLFIVGSGEHESHHGKATRQVQRRLGRDK